MKSLADLLRMPVRALKISIKTEYKRFNKRSIKLTLWPIKKMSGTTIYVPSIRAMYTTTFDISIVLGISNLGLVDNISKMFSVPNDFEIKYLNSYNDIMINDQIIMRNVPRVIHEKYKLCSYYEHADKSHQLTYSLNDQPNHMLGPGIIVVYNNNEIKKFPYNFDIYDVIYAIMSYDCEYHLKIQDIKVQRSWAKNIWALNYCRTFDVQQSDFYPKLTSDPEVTETEYLFVSDVELFNSIDHYIIMKDNKKLKLPCTYSFIKDLPEDLEEIMYLKNFKYVHEIFIKRIPLNNFCGFEDIVIR